MPEYQYLENTDINTINQLASKGWQVVKVEQVATESFNVFFGKNLIASSQELIVNEDAGRQFYVDKTVSYGDVLVCVFLMLFLIFGVMKFILDFFIPKLINLKR